MQELPTNIRVASWLGAKCLQHFQKTKSISDAHLDAFRQHVEGLVAASDIPGWDAQASRLEVAGLGYSMPPSLSRIPELQRLVEAIREISASQIYGAYRPDEVAKFLKAVVRLSGMDLKQVDLSMLNQYSAVDGWGEPLTEAELQPALLDV